MDKKKVIYIGLLLILTVIVSITYFSYAFFTHRDEQHGKLNIVTGTLDYKIGSADLTNNSITLEANKSKQIEIEITSLNNIDSKYELYYQTTASNIVVGYGSSNDTPTGTILANGKKTVKVVVKNKSNSQATIVFGVEGGFINNSLVLSTGSHITDIIDSICNYDTGYAWNFPFDPDGDGQGQAQIFAVPCDGLYQLEVWGAQGGDAVYYNGSTSFNGGYGGYSIGISNLVHELQLHIYVGEKPTLSGSCRIQSIGGYNGGGNGGTGDCNANLSEAFAAGGGATHIATESGLLRNLSAYINTGGVNISNEILIVAGGGGGSVYYNNKNSYISRGYGGNGGGYTGSNSTQVYRQTVNGAGGTTTHLGYGGTQTASSSSYNSTYNGGFGYGGGGSGGGGGGGWYGGTAGGFGAGGGSGYIASSNLTSSSLLTKHMYCYNCATSTASDTYTISNGTSSCHNSVATADCAKEGNGYARITYLGE